MKEIIVRAIIAFVGIVLLIIVPYYSGVFLGYLFPSIDKDLHPVYWLLGLASDLLLFIIFILAYHLINWIINGDEL